MPLQTSNNKQEKKKPSLMDVIKSFVSITPTKFGVSSAPISQAQPTTHTRSPGISNFKLGAKVMPTIKPATDVGTNGAKPPTFGEFQSMQNTSTPTGKFMLPENSTVPTTWVPISSAGVPSTPTLRSGSRGEEVRAIQSMLGIPVDGIFGPQTQAAILAFQKANGLSADGIVGPNTWSALLGGGKVSSDLSGGASTGGSGAKSTTQVSTPTTTSQSDQTPTVQSVSRPEWTFNYQQPEAPDLQSLIAAAAQQLAPQYDILERQMSDTNKEALQAIENDMIRRGRFLSTYAGNRQDQQNQKYQQALSDLGVQEQTLATELGRQDYDKAIERQQQDYARAYQEAMDAYARSWDLYTDQYRRDQDALNNALREREMALMEKQASAPRYTSSSSKTNSSNWTAGDRNTYNDIIETGSSIYNDFKNRSITYGDTMGYINSQISITKQGMYNPELQQKILEYLAKLKQDVQTEYERVSREQRKAAR